jgi:hypothetical protein
MIPQDNESFLEEFFFQLAKSSHPWFWKTTPLDGHKEAPAMPKKRKTAEVPDVEVLLTKDTVSNRCFSAEKELEIRHPSRMILITHRSSSEKPPGGGSYSEERVSGATAKEFAKDHPFALERLKEILRSWRNNPR